VRASAGAARSSFGDRAAGRGTSEQASVEEQRDEDDDRDRYAEQPKKDRTHHELLVS
jgi:hypothetical protein